MAHEKNISGNRYGRLVAHECVGRDAFGIAMWRCICDCKKSHIVRLCSLTSGSTKSCGCLNDETRKSSMMLNKRARTHGLSNHQLYQTWATMKQRCFNPKHAKYYLYGGRGISVCDEWKKSFSEFVKDMGDRPQGFSLNRIDNSKGYYKENCEWSTYSDQNRNRRPYTRK